MTIINSSLNLTKKEVITGRNISRGIMRHSQGRIEYELLTDLEKPLNNLDQAKKEQLLRILSEFGVPKNALLQIKNAKRLDELFASIINFPRFLAKKTLPKQKTQLQNKHSTSLQEEQNIYKFRNFLTACRREMYTIFSKKSTNPEVIKIENILKEKYGVQNASLGDDLELGQRLLQAVKLAKNKGIKIPNEFIVTPFTLGGGECMRLPKNGEEICTVLLPPTSIRQRTLQIIDNVFNTMSPNIKQSFEKWQKFCGFKTHGSTNSPMHMEIHEIMHQTHSPLVAFSSKEIPAKYLPVVRRLSAYSAMNEKNNYEIYTELATKNVLGKLEPDEKELFKFLGGDV